MDTKNSGPLIVYVDSNIFIRSGFDFKSKPLLSLQLYSRLGHIKIILTEVTYLEVKSHYKEYLEKEVNKLETFLMSPWIDSVDELKNFKPMKDLMNEKKKEELVISGLKGWDDYISKCTADVLTIENVDLNTILQKHFNCEPPFSKKKSNEFKDAIIIDIITHYMKRINGPLYIVSGDRDYSYLTNGNSIILMSDIRKFLAHINEEYYNETTRMLNNFILSERARSSIHDYVINSLAFDYDYALLAQDKVDDYDVDDVEIANCSVVSVENIDKANMEASVIISVTAEISFSYECIDYETAIKNPEDHRYFYHQVLRVQTIFQKEISFRVVVNIGESEELLDLEIESVEPYGDKRIALFDSNQIDRQKEVIEEEFEPEY